MHYLSTLLMGALLLAGVSAARCQNEQDETEKPIRRKLGPLFTHQLLDNALQRHVKEGRFNYASAKSDQDLEKYVASLAEAQPETFTSDEQRIAFWVNAYNACVIKGVLDRYPVKSVRNIPKFFTAKRYAIASSNYSLNDIENLLKRQFKDPRAAFLLCRGSVGGPRVPDRAYYVWNIAEQLEKASREFINSTKPENVIVNKIAYKVTLSPLFKWYEKEFARFDGVAQFISRRLKSQTDAKFLIHEHYTIDYSFWNWRLNDIKS